MRVAIVEDNLIINVCKFLDGKSLPENHIDVTECPCNIGDPVVDGIPVAKPSKWHTLNGLEWVIAPENQTLKDEAEHVPTNDEIYDKSMQNSRLLKAVVLALNDGSFVPGDNLSGSELKNIIKDKL